MIKRIYVEKKPGFDVEATQLFEDIVQDLAPANLEAVRIINRYDIEDIDEETYIKARNTIFSEPAIDNAYDEEMDDLKSANYAFAVEFLPGQFDQRADSAEQCIKLIKPDAKAVVKFAKIVMLMGKISSEDAERIEKYCINPVDSQIASMDKPETLKMAMSDPADVAIIEDFISKTQEQLEQFRTDGGYAMSRGDMLFVQEYFRDTEKRNPTMTELKVIDTYWSDHCRHTTFNTKLEDFHFGDSRYGEVVRKAFEEYLEMRDEVYGEREKDICLMDMACLGAKYVKKHGKGADIDESEEINACSIKVKATVDGKEEDWLVMFKNETHNHPTEIEPFGGAATCLGGAIRDPLSGRVYVYQAMRVTGAADPRTPIEETIKGKLPQRKITREAAHGYSSYGNQIGLAAGQIDEVYHDNYVAKRMEVGAVVGAAPASHVIRKRPDEGDVIILVGGRTGRDGCGGATGSSKGHTEESIETCGAEVQKGNPPIERNIQRMFRRKEVANMIKRCNDFGAGGVSVAIGELADGLKINLDAVPKKYDSLDGTELAISESQERMAVVVEAANEAAFKEYAAEENLEATTVAVVTAEPRITMNWRGQTVLDLSRAFLDTNGVKQLAKVTIKTPELYDTKSEQKEMAECLEKLNCCSRKGLIERFDNTIGASTVLMPLGGKNQLSPQAGMAAKLPMEADGRNMETATVMAYGYDPDLAERSPFHGGMYAVVDSVTKIVAMGGEYDKVRLSFQEYFGKTATPETWGKPFAALLGSLKVQKELMLPAIGGKDSMSGTFMDIDVPPALISFAITTTDADKVISSELKGTNSKIVLVKADYDEDGIIDFDKYKETMVNVHQLMLKGKVMSALNVGKGGIFTTAVKMAVGNGIGVEMYGGTAADWTEEKYGRLLLEIDEDGDICEEFEYFDYKIIGETNEENRITVKNRDEKVIFDMEIDEVIRKWEAPLESTFPVRTADYKKKQDETKVEKISFTERNEAKPSFRAEFIKNKPKVVIPVFPGTNCEIDSARAFIKAGAEADIHIIRNLNSNQLMESIHSLAEKIKNSQMVMIPGGFSGGDEPDGSAKFITSVFRNPEVAEAVTDLMDNREGLMLGICNGFQALIKLGLVPYGKIVEPDTASPTLTYNKIGRHAACYVNTRIASVKSPWFANTDVDEVFTIPVSHGEGRFIADEKLAQELIKNGQIATQYVDFNGNPSMDIAFNPNYSVMAIEGITSPDGRILGKMGHSERIGADVCKNIPGNKDMKIFEAGVAYFK